jgi:hypothetical protein
MKQIRSKLCILTGSDAIRENTMKAMILFIGWCILFVLCWPLALLALILLPLVWLISLPLRLVGITLGAVFALLKSILYLPARLLGLGKTPPRAVAVQP